MRIKNSIKLILLATGLLLGATLPGTALAIPTDYSFGDDASLDVSMKGRTFGAASGEQAARRNRLSIRLSGGRITFDPATGHLTHVEVRVRGQRIRLHADGFRVARGSQMSGGEPVFLRLISRDHPRISLVMNLRVSPIVDRDRVAANPVPEPTAAMLFGAGLLAVGSATRRNR